MASRFAPGLHDCSSSNGLNCLCEFPILHELELLGSQEVEGEQTVIFSVPAG